MDARELARRQLASACVDEVRRAIPLQPVVVVLMLLALRGRLPAGHLAAWTVLVLADVVRGLVASAPKRRDAIDGDVARWRRHMALHGLCGGLAWSTLVVLAAVAHDREALDMALLVNTGVASAMLGVAPFREHFVATVGALVVPGAVSAFALGGDSLVVGVLALIYGVVVVGVQGRLADARLDAAAVSHANAALASELDREHALVRSMNDRLSEANEQLARRAQHDPLTGLANRSLLLDTLAAAARDAGPGSVLAVCYGDLDGFKPVNDLHGHRVGDHLLVAVAERLRNAVAGSDLVARIGGDEFVVVAAGLPSAHAALPVAERLRAAAGAPFAVDGATVRVGMSIGMVVADRFCTAAELLRLADEALYQVKRADRGGIAAIGLPERVAPPVAKAS